MQKKKKKEKKKKKKNAYETLTAKKKYQAWTLFKEHARLELGIPFSCYFNRITVQSTLHTLWGYGCYIM